MVSYDRPLFDLARLTDTVSGHEIGGIVHAAGMSDPDLSIGMPAATVAANAIGTLNVLEAGRLAEFEGRLVLLSSTEVHEQPRTPFAATKAFGDLLGEVYTHTYGLDVVSLRFGEAYGPGRKLPTVLQEIIDAARASRPLRLVEDEERPYYLIHVDDVARAIVAALDARSPIARIYDIRGERVWLDRVAAIVRDRLPGAQIEIGACGTARIDPQEPFTAPAAYRELGYRPRWSLARGIDDFCAWGEGEEAC